MPNYVALRTPVPGPKSRAVLDRLPDIVPRAVSVFAPLVVDHAHGSLMTDIDGNTFIDLTGGIGVLNVGHTADRVQAALHDQIGRFLHTDFTVVPYESYLNLAERLNRRFPGGGPARTIFFNSGAEAVENAIKIARSYTRRRAVIAFERAFHGRTLMAMSLTSKVHPYKAGMGPFAPEVYRVPFPYPYRCGNSAGESPHNCDWNCFRMIEEALLLQVAPEDVAAVVVEPVQGEGGFVVPPPSFLPWLRQWTAANGILLVMDEIQTGFGRTGTFFATEQFDVVPDMVAAAKSIADGLPLSAVIGKPEVMNAPPPSSLGGTFVGNPLATVAGGAVLDEFDQTDIMERGRAMGNHLRAALFEMAERIEVIGDVRGLGAMVAIELVSDRQKKTPAADLTQRVLDRAARQGVLLLKAGVYNNVIRFLAPLNTPLDLLDEALGVLADCLVEENRHKGD